MWHCKGGGRALQGAGVHNRLPPVWLLVPERTRVPRPLLVRSPAPPRSPDNSVVTPPDVLMLPPPAPRPHFARRGEADGGGKRATGRRVAQGQAAGRSAEIAVGGDAHRAPRDHLGPAGIAVGRIVQHQRAAARHHDLARGRAAAIGDLSALDHRPLPWVSKIGSPVTVTVVGVGAAGEEGGWSPRPGSPSRHCRDWHREEMLRVPPVDVRAAAVGVGAGQGQRAGSRSWSGCRCRKARRHRCQRYWSKVTLALSAMAPAGPRSPCSVPPLTVVPRCRWPREDQRAGPVLASSPAPVTWPERPVVTPLAVPTGAAAALQRQRARAVEAGRWWRACPRSSRRRGSGRRAASPSAPSAADAEGAALRSPSCRRNSC